MTPWITLTLASMLGLTAAGSDPVWLHTPWAGLGSAFHAAHPLFLGTLALALMLAAVPLELRVGRGGLLASWSLPLLLQFWLWGRAWPELGALSLLATLLLVSVRRSERLPWKVWGPLLVAEALTLYAVRPSWLALALTLAVGLAVGRWARSEPVQILGWAGGGALMLAWLS
ncbi:MAG: hypothetical protein KF760_16690 [Candidatus Eremiobacteraeota bacterium]|nr:hypothetical protein [Candidatus Eremiobacteraeota bacterium]MCW5866485.1 hypothetical protein [Candidatus Eremiobacteraeota bacterium]